MTTHARGTFTVEINPLQPYDTTEGTPLGRRSIDKVFNGDLQATSVGEMLSAISGVEGSAGYVAIERVSGTLHGRHGSFVLLHMGIMTRGEQRLTITVVPNSATDQLVGLVGTVDIAIVDGQHTYDFAYTVEEPS